MPIVVIPAAAKFSPAGEERGRLVRRAGAEHRGEVPPSQSLTCQPLLIGKISS
jgi:hypothetical protein